MTRRVLLHVGTPKTGTSFFQDVLFQHRELLAQHGVHYPADRFDAHFLAALDLLRLPWGGLEREAAGAWDRLAEQVLAVDDGTVVISHEILAHASRSETERARRSLGVGDGTELHVVISARDLLRQIPAEWQENVKHRATLTYAAFLDQLRDPERAGRIGSWFWRVQELPDILDRWAPGLAPEHVHVVTVPPPGSDPGLLWKRFTHAFGLDGLDFDLTRVDRANPSLGAPETALLRRLNARINKVVEPADYRPLVRELLAHQTLSQRRGTPRLSVPPELRGWVHDLSTAWVESMRDSGYDVIGDLDELVGTPGPEEYTDPDRPKAWHVGSAAVDALQATLVESVRLRAEEARLHRELHEARVERDRAVARYEATYGRRVRRRVRSSLEGNRPGRAMLRLYRWARGRSSRAA